MKIGQRVYIIRGDDVIPGVIIAKKLRWNILPERIFIVQETTTSVSLADAVCGLFTTSSDGLWAVLPRQIVAHPIGDE